MTQSETDSGNSIESETEDEVVEAIKYMIAESLAVSVFASSGMFYLSRHMHQVHPDVSLDNFVLIGDGEGSDADTRPLGMMQWGDLLREFDRGGSGHTVLFKQWAVTLMADWEPLRERLAAARGVPVEEVMVDALGDLRLYRNDIVHNKGRASKDWSGRAKVLKWFKPGEVIDIDTHHLVQFLDALPWEAVPRALPTGVRWENSQGQIEVT
ncbi:hypothetical protein SAMN04488570_0303 [Nocardioides scoriae]|uniref:Uncharacterized protein n=1 Tax=Nocardioides scoriae TaxID=642780 RepID=A0A1H1LQK1_9ACTN|nr:hypothetical protein [Nocardioides scoriae]SDR76325.1 hypothetical protein SAMN04488570_0303 [Nocardioides scoriae]